jgi:hypothetical protein
MCTFRFSLLVLACWVGSWATAASSNGRIQVEGAELVVRLDEGRVLRREALIGVTLVLAGGQGDANVRIDGAEQIATRGRSLTLYRMSVQDADGGWRDLCRPDPDGRRAAFAFPDEAKGFNLTCTSGAEGKCVLMGYHPWHAREGVPLGELHRACIHMMRADYGGDGRSTARDGTAINIYDPFGIQNPGPAPGMRFEAAWGPEGAVCVSHPRIADNVSLEELAERYPHLRGRLGPQVCYEDAMRMDPRAILFNQSTVTWRTSR